MELEWRKTEAAFLMNKNAYIYFHSVYRVFYTRWISLRLPRVYLLHEPVAGEPIPLDGVKPFFVTFCHLEFASQSNVALQSRVFWHIEIDDSDGGT